MPPLPLQLLLALLAAGAALAKSPSPGSRRPGPDPHHAHKHGHGEHHAHRPGHGEHHAHKNPDGSYDFSCGTAEPSPGELRRLALPEDHEDVMRAVYAPRSEGGGRRLQGVALETVTFPLMIFHVLKNPAGDGYLTNANLQYQFDQLNAAFAPYIGFGAWERRDYTVDNAFFSDGCLDGMDAFKMDNAVPNALNTYFLDCLGSGVYGYAEFPESFPEDSPLHGTVNDYRSAIQGDEVCTGGCEGKTAVHEWGHAFGLLHTFTTQLPGSCDCEVGDLIEDTPPEYAPYFGGGTDNCAPRDSCAESPNANDPVTNFMNYSDDVCLAEFTPGQFWRMLYMLAATKPNMLAASLGAADPAACVPGYFYEAAAAACLSCPYGTYQDEPGQTSCKACPEDSRSVQRLGGLGNGYPSTPANGGSVNVNQCYAEGCFAEWMHDLYCDEINNTPECNYDGGDCCQACCNAHPEFVPQGNSYSCGDGESGFGNFAQCLDADCSHSDLPFDDSTECVEEWVGDLYCDEVNNKEACEFDGGDCCEACCGTLGVADSSFTCGDGDSYWEDFVKCKDPDCSRSSLTLDNPGSQECANLFVPLPEGWTAPPTASRTAPPTASDTINDGDPDDIINDEDDDEDGDPDGDEDDTEDVPFWIWIVVAWFGLGMLAAIAFAVYKCCGCFGAGPGEKQKHFESAVERAVERALAQREAKTEERKDAEEAEALNNI